MINFWTVLLVGIIALGLGGCATFDNPCCQSMNLSTGKIVSTELALVAASEPVVVEEKAVEAVAVVAAPAPQVIEIKDKVLFAFDEYSLDEEALETVVRVADLMADYPDTLLVLRGHTDKYGTAEYNQLLSENRAMSVKEALMDYGVSEDRIVESSGFGKSDLIANVTNRENRRVLILSADTK